MKSFFSIAAILFSLHGFSQSSSEAQILKLSNDVFTWEVENKINLLENIFDTRFVVVNGTGESKTRDQYITLLKSGNFKHDSIHVEENTAAIVNNTATVIGKGTFLVTASGKKMSVRLSYIEVFTRPDAKEDWKIMAMHASILSNE